jgi:hypothetical protein
MEKPVLELTFSATQSEPDYAKLFLSTGGSINAAAGPGKTDFSLTGSETAETKQLQKTTPVSIAIQLPQSIYAVENDQVVIDSRVKLNVVANRTGAAINGTIVDTHAGAGSMYLSTLLDAGQKKTHVQLPLIYGSLAAHSATIGASQAQIIDDAGCVMDVVFKKDDASEEALAAAEQAIDAWAHAAWDRRESGLVYTPSPSLTKTVAKSPVGINDKGYDLVHNILDREFPFDIDTLDSLLENATGMELDYDDLQVIHFLEQTSTPSLEASLWAQTIAAACSTVANYLISYRADGRTAMAPTGSAFVPVESWLHTAMRTPLDANDCDGSALLVTSLLQRAIDASADELETHKFVRAVRNAVFPYYVVGVTVVGATAAEASEGGGGTEHVAGHALALMVPTLSLLTALDKATTNHTVKATKLATDPHVLRGARFGAVFNEEVLEQLPTDEQAVLAQGPEVVRAMMDAATESNEIGFHSLVSFAIEGTTPASPCIFVDSSEKMKRATSEARRDATAFAKLAPNVGRSFKTLYAGGSGKNPHRFYRDFVEFSVHPSHPLYASSTIRKLGHATSQFVFAADTIHENLGEAGVSPKQLVKNQFLAVPLHAVDEPTAQILDFASAKAKADVVPRRRGIMQLSAAQTRDLTTSLAALKELDKNLSKKEAVGHPTAYLLSFATMVNNPKSIEHFCDIVSKRAPAGELDFKITKNLALAHGTGEQAGIFVVVNAVIA